MTTRREFLRHAAILGGGAVWQPSSVPVLQGRHAGLAAWICPPCGCAMDGRVFDAPGKCPACGMNLVEQRAAPLPFEPERLEPGRGAFLTRGGIGHESHRITVAYYMPTRFTPQSRVLLVLPGSGRDAADYREPWIARAEKANMLVAALGYPETMYDIAAYQMGGVISNLVLRNMPSSPDEKPPTVLRLRDEDITFMVNPRRETWIFPDFDRIFGLLVEATGSTAMHYDMFGHSAGAQILHRLALFHPHSKARRLMAANAGLYTMPSLDEPQLAGLAGTGITRSELASAFGVQLHVLLGELDNDGERGGIHLHTPALDRYGVSRLERGRHFFAEGERQAKAMNTPLTWRLDVIPRTGHDHERMGAAAARELYGIPESRERIPPIDGRK